MLNSWKQISNRQHMRQINTAMKKWNSLNKQISAGVSIFLSIHICFFEFLLFSTVNARGSFDFCAKTEKVVLLTRFESMKKYFKKYWLSDNKIHGVSKCQESIKFF